VLGIAAAWGTRLLKPPAAAHTAQPEAAAETAAELV
jgi:hypothetical protein